MISLVTFMAVGALAVGFANSDMNGNNPTGDKGVLLSEMREVVKSDVKADYYMLEDYFLEKWVRQNNFNVKDAVSQFLEYLNWRKEQRIDTILEEDWGEMRKRFPYSIKTTDKTGRPILYRELGQWDLAGFLDSQPSSFDHLVRYGLMMFEDSEARVRQLRAEKGSNITKFVHLINAAGFTAGRYACDQCLEFIMTVAKLRKNIPSDMGELVIVNAPRTFTKLYSLLLGRNARVYGQDRDQWKKELLEFIDPDQFPERILDDPLERDNSDGRINLKQEL